MSMELTGAMDFLRDGLDNVGIWNQNDFSEEIAMHSEKESIIHLIGTLALFLEPLEIKNEKDVLSLYKEKYKAQKLLNSKSSATAIVMLEAEAGALEVEKCYGPLVRHELEAYFEFNRQTQIALFVPDLSCNILVTTIISGLHDPYGVKAETVRVLYNMHTTDTIGTLRNKIAASPLVYMHATLKISEGGKEIIRDTMELSSFKQRQEHTLEFTLQIVQFQITVSCLSMDTLWTLSSKKLAGSSCLHSDLRAIMSKITSCPQKDFHITDTGGQVCDPLSHLHPTHPMLLSPRTLFFLVLLPFDPTEHHRRRGDLSSRVWLSIYVNVAGKFKTRDEILRPCECLDFQDGLESRVLTHVPKFSFGMTTSALVYAVDNRRRRSTLTGTREALPTSSSSYFISKTPDERLKDGAVGCRGCQKAQDASWICECLNGWCLIQKSEYAQLSVCEICCVLLEHGKDGNKRHLSLTTSAYSIYMRSVSKGIIIKGNSYGDGQFDTDYMNRQQDENEYGTCPTCDGHFVTQKKQCLSLAISVDRMNEERAKTNRTVTDIQKHDMEPICGKRGTQRTKQLLIQEENRKVVLHMDKVQAVIAPFQMPAFTKYHSLLSIYGRSIPIADVERRARVMEVALYILQHQFLMEVGAIQTTQHTLNIAAYLYIACLYTGNYVSIMDIIDSPLNLIQGEEDQRYYFEKRKMEDLSEVQIKKRILETARVLDKRPPSAIQLTFVPKRHPANNAKESAEIKAFVSPLFVTSQSSSSSSSSSHVATYYPRAELGDTHVKESYSMPRHAVESGAVSAFKASSQFVGIIEYLQERGPLRFGDMKFKVHRMLVALKFAEYADDKAVNVLYSTVTSNSWFRSLDFVSVLLRNKQKPEVFLGALIYMVFKSSRPPKGEFKLTEERVSIVAQGRKATMCTRVIINMVSLITLCVNYLGSNSSITLDDFITFVAKERKTSGKEERKLLKEQKSEEGTERNNLDAEGETLEDDGIEWV